MTARTLAVLAVAGAALGAGGPATADPRWLLKAPAERSPDVVYFVETEQPWVGLTIDDGPDPTTTPRILDTLKRHGALPELQRRGLRAVALSELFEAGERTHRSGATEGADAAGVH